MADEIWWGKEYFCNFTLESSKKCNFQHKIELSSVFYGYSRDIIEDFRLWKDSDNRKPILLIGARQIGKTWAAEEFGRQCFEYCVRFDFYRQPELKSIFQVHNVMRMFPVTFKEFLNSSDPETYEYVRNLTEIGRLPEIIPASTPPSSTKPTASSSKP